MPKPVFSVFAAPHRIAFLPGVLLSILLLAGWSGEMLARLSGGGLPLAMPAFQAHGFLMLFGFFPLFMTGFLLTAGPRWLNAPPPGVLLYLSIPVLILSGIALFAAGAACGGRWLLSGWLVYSFGFAGLAVAFARLIWQSRAMERRHALTVLAALLAGVAALACAGFWLLTGDARGWLWMRDLALWGFLLPVFLTVCHRMLPFFTANAVAPYQAWRPWWLLAAMVGGSWAHGALSMADAPSWPLDALMAVLFAYISWRWGLCASLQVRLLAMLHLSFAWLAAGFALFAWQGVFGGLAWAPLHAVTVGFFLTMVIAFVSRVSLGHSGRPLQAAPWLWRLYLAAHALALARVLADCLPAHWRGGLYAAASIGWLLAATLWGGRFLPVYLLPRSDGKPG
ncbi:NnrS family protein [Chromobacterium sp. IIBBL 290-4]|uniref:NnrS family protein n=1 Tax=Chromobacterium sp. IIBBL 290-4 TaxID=2953890 RepID=UPI0020B87E28|nr:NnrS family protein [Chromobacterium sp. IIBBL 290-4]UTH73769.1 NnrS family protein [Chromobacterium sp. IIBBL 290-4]